MNHKKISLMLAAPLASTTAWGLTVTEAALEMGRAQGRYEICQKPQTATAECPALLKALLEATRAFGAAEVRNAKPAAENPATEKPQERLEGGISKLLEDTQKIQTRVEKLRPETERRKLFNTMDAARDLAMGVNTGSPYASEALEDARRMPSDVNEIGKLMTKAQEKANEAVSQGLMLRQCGTAGGPGCKPRDEMFREGEAAFKSADESIRKVEEKIKQLRTDVREITATEAGLDAQQRAAYLKFDEGLESLPNARSLLGGDTIGLVAAKEDAQVALQVGYDIKKGLLGRNRVSFHMTAPLGAGAKRADVFNNVDGLSSQGSVGFGYGMARANPLGDGLYRAMFGATLSRKTHQYLVDNAGQVEQGEQKVKPWRVGIEVEYALFGAKGTAHRVSVFHERKWQDGKAGVHCPGGATSTAMVSCLSGPLGAPKQVEGTTASYAYHFRFNNGMAMAPRLSYDSATKGSGLDVPIYLIVSKEKKTELNAGIQVGWTRKPGKDGEPAQNDFGFGLFVGAPFGLLSGGGVNSR
ncbi:hypothetical protein ABIC83_001551 [Roseateles asaccharophilus]